LKLYTRSAAWFNAPWSDENIFSCGRVQRPEQSARSRFVRYRTGGLGGPLGERLGQEPICLTLSVDTVATSPDSPGVLRWSSRMNDERWMPRLAPRQSCLLLRGPAAAWRTTAKHAESHGAPGDSVRRLGRRRPAPTVLTGTASPISTPTRVRRSLLAAALTSTSGPTALTEATFRPRPPNGTAYYYWSAPANSFGIIPRLPPSQGLPCFKAAQVSRRRDFSAALMLDGPSVVPMVITHLSRGMPTAPVASTVAVEVALPEPVIAVSAADPLPRADRRRPGSGLGDNTVVHLGTLTVDVRARAGGRSHRSPQIAPDTSLSLGLMAERHGEAGGPIRTTASWASASGRRRRSDDVPVRGGGGGRTSSSSAPPGFNLALRLDGRHRRGASTTRTAGDGRDRASVVGS